MEMGLESGFDELVAAGDAIRLWWRPHRQGIFAKAPAGFS
jgi:hypothetical protein